MPAPDAPTRWARPPAAKRAADRLWVLTSFDAFDLLYSGRGLSANEVARVLVDTAERTVLAGD